MYTFLIIIHVIASLILIAVILLQAGRGGGLSEMFGGSSTQTLFGTSAVTLLKKATTIAAIVFLATSLTLAIYSSRRSKSLMERTETLPAQKGLPAIPEATEEKVQPPVEQDDTE